ncbi:phosphoribosylglycinamide formyltransferase [Candidatus Pelagibacter sp.]|uniref:phosphoribosylglycinamide formyltransferase n=1 Tax=Candidatus Pelagibacter sp. TaxID=2024849 RepID=UPI003F859E45
MVKSTGLRKVNVAVFISGTGSNLFNLIKQSKLKNSKYIVKYIFSDKKNAGGLKFAKKFKISYEILNYKNKINAETKSLKYLKLNNIKIICLAGFMKILSAAFIKSYKGKIINIHPSLLPKYKGLNTHQRALDNNEKFSGCTVHYVNTKLDAGKIILQKKVKVNKNDNAKILAKKILRQEHKIYPLALNKIISSL